MNMKQNFQRLTSLLLIFAMVISFFCIPSEAEEFSDEMGSLVASAAAVVTEVAAEAESNASIDYAADLDELSNENVSKYRTYSDINGVRVDINDPSVFLKQTESTCTLFSNLMLFRRAAILNGDSEWDSINYINYSDSWWAKGNGMVFYPTARGMSGSVTGIADDRGYVISSNNCGFSNLEDRRYFFQYYLSTHPEGIVIYLYRLDSSGREHAVLLTDYDAMTDTFYCADPANSSGEGRIPLAESLLTEYTDNVPDKELFDSNYQDIILAYVKQVWSITGGVNYPLNDWVFFAQSEEIQAQCEHDFKWDEVETDVCHLCGMRRFHDTDYPLPFVTVHPDVACHQLPYWQSRTIDTLFDEHTEVLVTARIRNQYHELWLMLSSGTWVSADEVAFQFDKMQDEAYHAVHDLRTLDRLSNGMAMSHSFGSFLFLTWIRPFSRMYLLFAPGSMFDLKTDTHLGLNSHYYFVYYQGEVLDDRYTGEQLGNIFYGYVSERVGISQKDTITQTSQMQNENKNLKMLQK